MKKVPSLILLISLFLISYVAAICGGIVTNLNQSASYVRMPVRDASTEIDAVYFNPAGLTMLPDGFSFSISNQSIFQKKTIENNYLYLNDHEYVGDVSAPLFPTAYAVYKTGDLVFSLGFNPSGGGGSAKYDNGLPSFELNISDLVPALSSKGITAYSSDLYFEGNSTYWGLQGGVSYKVCDEISVFGGARVVFAGNDYKGHIRSNTIYFGTATNMPATQFFQSAYSQYTAASQQALQAGDSILSKSYADTAAMMSAKATLLADQEVDVFQSGTGFSPILGVNLKLLNGDLNIGMKYEFITKLKLKNETKKDITVGFLPTGTPITQFPDGKESNADIPALFTFGVSYKLMPNFTAAAGVHYFFDKDANWDGREKSIDENSYELALGLEYGLTDDISISAGYLYSSSGGTIAYNTDMSFVLSSNSVGFGGKIKITDKINMNLGYLFSSYDPMTKEYIHSIAGTANVIPVKEQMRKTNNIFSIGFDFLIGCF